MTPRSLLHRLLGRDEARAPHPPLHEPLAPNRRNKYVAAWEYATGAEVVTSIPPNLQVARSNRCNFHCVYCADHREGSTIPRSMLDERTWEGLLALIPRTELMAFHGVSEFLIDPDFFDIVARCAKAGVAISLNTNGSVCTPRHVQALVEHPALVVMTISLDAATAETYRAIRGWDFDRVVRNVRTWVEAFRQRPIPWITLSFVITKTNVHEMADFVRLGHALGVNMVRFNRLHEYGMQWRIPTPAGGVFDYEAETTAHYADAYNTRLDEARAVADALHLPVELPAPYHARGPA